MSNEAWNKITQTHELFKKIIAPLKQHLGINFGYMIAFNDGRYYQIIEDLECLKAWITNVETSHIFCARNVTTYFDVPYNFTIWPEKPNCLAMEIYKEHGMWNGITVSKVNKEYTELYWFTKENAESSWHKWFIRNKPFLMQFIECFISNKQDLCIPIVKKNLFKFNKEFLNCLQKSEYVKQESSLMKQIIILSQQNFMPLNDFKTQFSQRETEVLKFICSGYTYKMCAQELAISPNTVHHHIEKIKQKIGSRSKFELISLYKKLTTF